MIKTFADCPYRYECIKTTEEVLNSSDYRNGLCLTSCPQSPRNSDYSRCYYPGVGGKRYKHCSTVKRENFGGDEVWLEDRWCEANTQHKQCPMGFAR